MQSAISNQEIELVIKEIQLTDLVLIRSRIVNKLYVNFKVIGTSDKIHQVVQRLNKCFAHTTRIVVANAGNIKLISRIINKGSALAYLKNFQLRSRRTIGIGNDVLDEIFFEHCDKVFVINSTKPCGESVKIESFSDVKFFLRRLYREVQI